MSKIDRKLEYYSYLIFKVNQGCESTPFLPIKDSSRLMRLLYFTCIESYGLDPDNSLFDIFTNWVSFSNGPVEFDVYIWRENVKKYNGRELDEVMQLIEVSVERMNERLGDKIYGDIGVLNNISKELPAYQNSYKYSMDLGMNIDIKLEYKTYINII